MKEIVAFVGRHGSGKDHQSKQLVEKRGYKKLAFADPLRSIFFSMIGLSEEEGNKRYDELRKTVIFKDGDRAVTGKMMIEKLGAEGIRKYDDEFLVKCLLREIEALPNGTNVCISDLRVPAEYLAVKKFADERHIMFKVVFCDFRSGRYDESAGHSTLRLPDFLIAKGYKDQDVVSDADMQEFCGQSN